MKRLLFALFALSGFSGLIYESIWTHYLKLFLGHAAYAQTLVLAIFMGGMAIGSWWCGAASTRWRNLLRGYALIEGVIGLAALAFHGVFDAFLQFAYDSLLPGLGSPLAVEWVKWISAALLILPQSILLGMTFPLMSGALIRRFPDAPGGSVAMLYFTNSIGAAAGVLVSGFALIELLGLPGTIQAAGILNLVLAAVVLRLSGSREEPRFNVALDGAPRFAESRWFYLLLGVSALTGAASFIYEIAWIRMLSMVLGSSTHAFELMLSAFILGLALGGLWVRRRIDALSNSLRFLAIVQLLMGVSAASTLWIYNQSFDVMAWLINNLAKDEGGYLLFNLSSHAIAAAVMIPTSFLAGTTLPLLTFTLLRQGHGEKSIGSVYAANTLGAITGVFFATHIGMTTLGLKGLLLVGAGLDVALGVAILWRIRAAAPPRQALAPAAIGVAALVVIGAFAHLDPLKMSSGVYRTGRMHSANTKVLFHRDGKTASVDLLQSANNETHRNVSILTNGKPDASVNMISQGPPAPDESTMILAGALPLAVHPGARNAAVIGFGSGLSTHTMLSGNRLDAVDTIEIESAMVEAARGFRPRVELAYSSPASRIFIDDAKTYFSTHNKRYDIILSEPSNPWVSGVASLFTEEFYAHVKRHLNPDGVLLQWIQTYEVDEPLVASVVKAMSQHFPNYIIYAPNVVDMIFIARADGAVPLPALDSLTSPAIRAELARVGIRNDHDLDLRRIGDARSLGPLFASYTIPPNSDYNPVVDLRAARSRFLQMNAAKFISFRNASIPALEILLASPPPARGAQTTQFPGYERTVIVMTAERALDYLLGGPDALLLDMHPRTIESLRFVRGTFIECRGSTGSEEWLQHLSTVANLLIPQLSPDAVAQVWQRIGTAPCSATLSSLQHQWLVLWTALTQRDTGAVGRIAGNLLATPTRYSHMQAEYLLLCALLSRVAGGDMAGAREAWNLYAPQLYQAKSPALVARLLAAHAFQGASVPFLAQP
jgi:predicted membrane-bound spermidine synthase